MSVILFPARLRSGFTARPPLSCLEPLPAWSRFLVSCTSCFLHGKRLVFCCLVSCTSSRRFKASAARSPCGATAGAIRLHRWRQSPPPLPSSRPCPPPASAISAAPSRAFHVRCSAFDSEAGSPMAGGVRRAVCASNLARAEQTPHRPQMGRRADLRRLRPRARRPGPRAWLAESGDQRGCCRGGGSFEGVHKVYRCCLITGCKCMLSS
jgi:hypothetical protein